MCGICGVIGFTDRQLLTRMCLRLKHRGPDSSGLFECDEGGLAATRLAMIDLERGTQPAHNEDDSIFLVFNGEVYDFKIWIPILESRGHRFYSKGDAETLVHMYEEFGLDFLSRVRGMFALAIFDGRSRSFILARDRFGVKPLYYASLENRFVFASELKALKGDFPFAFDPRGLPSYLFYRMAEQPFTMVRGVRKLTPGTYLLVHGEEITQRPYWTLPPPMSKSINGSSTSRLAGLLSEAVNLRLVSDVPLGIFLSGGIDSAAVAFLSAESIAHPIHTFTTGFGTEFDEFEPASEVARLIGSTHHEFWIQEEDLPSMLTDLAFSADEPNADPALIPTLALSKAASRYVKGVLLGEGADEVFGGYEQYNFMRILPTARRVHLPAETAQSFRLLSQFLDLPGLRFLRRMGEPGLRRIEAALKADTWIEAYQCLVGIHTLGELRKLSTPGLEDWVSLQKERERSSWDPVYFAQVQDISFGLPALLDRVDKATMAFSIEGREPFLDHQLVEFVLSLDASSRVGFFSGKRILRQALKSSIPIEIRKRRKQRFYVPIDEWFAGDLGHFFSQVVSTSELGVLNDEYFLSLLNRLSDAPLYYSRQLWSRLVLELWYRRYVLSQSEQTIGIPQHHQDFI